MGDARASSTLTRSVFRAQSGGFWDDQLRKDSKTCWKQGSIVVQDVQTLRQEALKSVVRFGMNVLRHSWPNRPMEDADPCSGATDVL